MKKRTNPFMSIYHSVNTGTNEEKYAKFKNGGGRLLPSYLDVELTNFCNYNCRFCPTGTKTMQRMRGMMPDKVVEAIAENVRKYHISGVRFIRWGEPTLHPEYIPIMDDIRKSGAIIHINTNGSFVEKEQIKRLLDIHLDSIKFSFQGADEGTYDEMRVGGDYKKLLETVRLFYEMRGNKDYPYIQISTTLTTENEEQIENFKNDVVDICDYYNIGYTKLNHLNVDNMRVSELEKSKISKIQRHEINNHKFLRNCPEAFDKLSINWNGDVTLCCSDYDNFMIIGNILDMDILELFNSKAADMYRSTIANRQYEKIKCCSTCWETVPLRK